MSRTRLPRFVVSASVTLAVVLYASGSTAVAQRVSSQRSISAPAQPSVQAPAPTEHLVLLAGRSMVIATGADIERFSFTDPEIADGLAVSRRELLINGKKPGTISLMVWSGGRMTHYELVIDSGTPSLQQRLQAIFPGEDIQVTTVGSAVVLSGHVTTNAVIERSAEIAKASGLGTVINLLQSRDSAPAVPALQEQIEALFPGEDIQVTVSGKAVILSGHVSSDAVLGHAVEIAQSSDPDKHVINLLQPTAAATSQQVMLQVRFAEVSHSVLTQLGANLVKSGDKNVAGVTTQQFTPLTGRVDQNGDPAVGDFLNLFFFQKAEGVSAVIKALQQSGSFESLAEPNLIAYNGKSASFLAGGSVPVVVPGTNGGAPTVTYQDYGVGLKFTPTIVGNMIHLQVEPEVSAIDKTPGAGVNIGSTVIPALTKRTARTEVELHDGQSFAIAGLLDTQGIQNKSAVPLLSKIPILGHLFRSKETGDSRRELLVLITPRLVQPLNPDQLPPLPKIIKKDGGTR
jgi:pilus assembly protein CpaC